MGWRRALAARDRQRPFTSDWGRPFVDRWGHLVHLRDERLDQIDAWFGRYGERTIFFSRLLPVVRTFVSLPAGMSRMPFVPFSMYTLLGSIAWSFALAGLGYWLGSQWHVIPKYGTPISIAIVALSTVGALVWARRRSARASRSGTEGD